MAVTTEQIKGLINAKIATYTRWKEQREKEISDIFDAVKVKSAADQLTEGMLKNYVGEIEKLKKKHRAMAEAIDALEWLLDDIDALYAIKEND